MAKMTRETQESCFETFFRAAESSALAAQKSEAAGHHKRARKDRDWAKVFYEGAISFARSLEILDEEEAEYKAANPPFIIPPFFKRDAGRPPIWSREPDEDGN